MFPRSFYHCLVQSFCLPKASRPFVSGCCCYSRSDQAWPCGVLFVETSASSCACTSLLSLCRKCSTKDATSSNNIPPERKLRNRFANLHDTSCVGKDSLHRCCNLPPKTYTAALCTWVVGAASAVGASKANPSPSTMMPRSAGKGGPLAQNSLPSSLRLRRHDGHLRMYSQHDVSSCKNLCHAALVPTRAFTREDLPEFGTPSTATCPLRWMCLTST